MPRSTAALLLCSSIALLLAPPSAAAPPSVLAAPPAPPSEAAAPPLAAAAPPVPSPAAAAPPAPPQWPAVRVTLDGATALHRYDGHGGLSAGASSRLLWDYAEPQRSEILDYLFKPSFGAGMHMLKIELGGDAQSTDGTEPSHMHSREDLSCSRGYELWLIDEARARNPAIATYGLAWGLPGWLNEGAFYGNDTITYWVNFLDCVVQRSGAPLDYLGLHNEASQPSPDFLVALRAALDAANHSHTKLSIMDNGYYNTAMVAEAQGNATYRDAIAVAGLHDPCEFFYGPLESARELGWALWSSEDFSRDVGSWKNSQNYWGKALSQHYVVMNITAVISWSLLWGVYSNLICLDSGLMRARWPQSGYYEVSPTIWLHAHWGQFTQPGWRFLHVPGGGSGFLTLPGASLHGGTYVTLVPPQGDPPGLTVIVETLADTSCLARNSSHFGLTFTVLPGASMPRPGTALYVWTSSQSALFVQQAPTAIAADGTFSLTVAPDTLTTVSTVGTAVHGAFPDSPVPAPAPWPLPYADAFDAYAYDSMARFFADQGGSWAVRNGTLQQVAEGQPIAWAPNGDPLSIVGWEQWQDYAVSATVVFGGKLRGSGGGGGGGLPWSSRRGAAGSTQRRHNRRRGGGGGAPGAGAASDTAAVYAAPCDASAGAQLFTYNASTGRLGSAWGGELGCLTTCGCNASCLQMWGCGVPGCNGGAAYDWSLSAGGGPAQLLTNAQYPGLALTASGTGSSLALLPAAATALPGQLWRYNASSQLVAAPALGLCLSQLRPTEVYAQVCGRVGAYDGFNAATTPAYCLAVYASGAWALLVNSGASGLGGRLAGFDAGAPHRLTLSMAGEEVDCYVDGALLGSVRDATYGVGNAALGSGWHECAWDDFEVVAPLRR